MKVILKEIIRIPFRIIIYLRWYSILAFLYSRIIEELTVDGATIRPSKHAKNNKYTILILSSKAFRKDIECIVATNEFRVLRLPDHWQSRLIYQFYPEGFQKYCVDTNPDHVDYKYKREQKELREFLHVFLAKLYKRISIDCVISPHHRYVSDMEWGAVSNKLGVPYILINRECQIASSPYNLEIVKVIFKDALPKFEGKHIIIQGEMDKPVYTDTGYAASEIISSLGCPRMDDFIKKSKENRIAKENRRKEILILPFIFGHEFDEKDLFTYAQNVYLFFVQFALRNPLIDVIIKHKSNKFLTTWKELTFNKVLRGSNIIPDKITNLKFLGDVDIHTLFFKCDVVCGLNTSALLEAAIIGLPVIIPFFKDLQNPKYEERVFYRDAFDLFDIAENVKDLESIILNRLQNPKINSETMKKREILFEKYISTLKADATENYVKLIKNIISMNKVS